MSVLDDCGLSRLETLRKLLSSFKDNHPFFTVNDVMRFLHVGRTSANIYIRILKQLGAVQQAGKRQMTKMLPVFPLYKRYSISEYCFTISVPKILEDIAERINSFHSTPSKKKISQLEDKQKQWEIEHGIR